MNKLPLALTWDDVALVPQFNNVNSRSEPSLGTWLTQNQAIDFPLIPSNMDTVISPKIAEEMASRKGAWILHRFHLTTPLKDVLGDYPKPYWISWGVKKQERNALAHEILTCGDDIAGICIDVAHAHSIMALETVEFFKKEYGDALQIIIGNVCTADGYRDLVNAGADAVRVGVGNGAACTTRMVTGFGIPQFTAIQNCAKYARKLRVPIIADGGIRNSRDIILALAAGASTVMMGKMFAACEESAAEKRERRVLDYEAVAMGLVPIGTINPDGIVVSREAKYRGQASFDFQQEFYGECRHAPEGEAFWIPVTGSVKSMLDGLEEQIKSGLTYGGARSIKELQRKAEFVRVTSTYRQESETRP